MRILVVGSGGREHALAWKIRQSPLVSELLCAPGNPGIAEVAELVPVRADDVVGLVREARARKVDLVVVGPEAPLVLGLVDRLADAGILAFGPTAGAAEIEGSKAFAKDVMRAAGVPTADAGVFTEVDPALAFARARGGQVVVKADGLAAGKGVVVCGSVEEADAALRAMLVGGVHGDAGRRVLVEERLTGPEASLLAICDGERVLLLPSAQDHKRVGEGDTGPNTGGMGAFSPTAKITPPLLAEVERTVFGPVLHELARRGRPFRGVLYAGLMLTSRGLRVLEFNARMGDPETQPVLMRVRGDLVPALLAAARGDLRGVALEVDPRPAVGVVLAAQGYPARPRMGDPIGGLERPLPPDVQVFHAGTARAADGTVVSAGGRVLTVCALGGTPREARAAAYRAMEGISLPGGHHRRDIGAAQEEA